MKTAKSFHALVSFFLVLGGIGLAVPSPSNPVTPAAQNRRDGGGRAPAAPQAPARRDVVRTRSFVPRAGAMPSVPRPIQPRPITIEPRPITTPNVPRRQNPGSADRISPVRTAPVRRIGVPATPRVVAQRTFTKTPAGRRYDNGLNLRKGMTVTAAWQRHYFPKGHYHFPFYRPTFVRGSCFISPFGFYFGICVPYISASVCVQYPPSVTFIDEPVYDGSNCTGFSDAQDQNFLDDQNLDQDEPGLNNALNELSETFQGGNIDGLVALIDPNTRIAIYLRGQYQYSMDANNYVDLTRDAILSMTNVSFNLTYLHQRAPGVFSACGTQTYRDPSGGTRTVYVSYVLQDISGQWTLTQAGTAPDVNQDL
jgi:hypothetical protein